MSGAGKDELLRLYLDALRERGGEPTDVYALSGERHTVIFIDGLGYVVVAVSIEFPGYWLLDKACVENIQRHAASENQSVWYALLIERRDGRGANGYILSEFASSPVKRPIEADGEQLIIREKRHLDSLRLILSTEKQAELLLRKRS